ncbi:hypothetical protein ACERII_22730 [Evansella sp. AB-rgal1]|uniref:hypothetical protein n=1 Tax=Evansella sp. AB-rgal1 TaxID=3242696 RepID=UPI00359CCFFD
MKRVHRDDVDEKLKNMPKPSVNVSKKKKIHNSLMNMDIQRSVKKPSFFRGNDLKSLGGFVAIGALVLFVFVATLIVDNYRKGDEILGDIENEMDNEIEVHQEEAKRTVYDEVFGLYIYEYLFKGESNHWEGEFYYFGEGVSGDVSYKVGNQTIEAQGLHSYELKLTYKGESVDIQNVEELEITTSVKGDSKKWEQSTNNLQSDKEYWISGIGFDGRRGSIKENDEYIEITVKWGNQEETITLYSSHLDEWEDRGPAVAHLQEIVSMYIDDSIDFMDLAYRTYHLHSENNTPYLVIASSEELEQSFKDTVLKLVDNKFDVEFRKVEFSRQQLFHTDVGLNKRLIEEKEYQSENFEIYFVREFTFENRVGIGIAPYTDQHAQELYDYLDTDDILVLDATEEQYEDLLRDYNINN